MNNIIISNCCLGLNIHNKLNNYKYNNPFIGKLILDDFQYLKLCKNIKKYMNNRFVIAKDILPSIYKNQTCNSRYIHPAIKTNYPILINNDINIHAIHDTNENNCVNKFYKRQTRFNNIIKKEKYKIFCVMTYTTLFLKHNNYVDYINNFLKNNDNDNNIIFLFVGPILEGITEKHYIIANYMNKNIIRHKNNVNIQLDFDKDSVIIVDYINKLN